MYTAEFDAFKQTLSDLCTAVNRPFNDDLVRVFWDDLRPHQLYQIQERARNLRRDGNQKFKSADLRPEVRSAGTFEPARTDLDHFARFGNIKLWKFLLTHDTKPEQLQALIDRKNQIINVARHDPDLQPGGDEEAQGQELHEILFSAWEKVIAS